MMYFAAGQQDSGLLLWRIGLEISGVWYKSINQGCCSFSFAFGACLNANAVFVGGSIYISPRIVWVKLLHNSCFTIS